MEKRITNVFLPVAVLLILAFVYKGWFLYPDIIGGDWPYVFSEYLVSVPLLPQLWNPLQHNGLGGFNPILNLSLFHAITTIPSVVWPYLQWHISYRIFWFGLFIGVSFLSSLTLIRKHFDSVTVRPWMVLAPLIYLTNTYVLMVVGGGQMGVALAYAIMPYVLSRILSAFQAPGAKSICLAGFILGIHIMLDPRIAYISGIAVAMYVLVVPPGFGRTMGVLSRIGAVAIALNAFWILPLAVLKNNPLTGLGPAYTSQSAVAFFSFADFSHTLSLLHPNWPENIFGKTRFLQPEFLLVPILVFVCLVFLRKNSNRRNLAYVSMLAVVGAFFSKGVNDPFGWLYLWLYQHIPGFVAFRDPTKFYMLTALSYSILIPVSIGHIAQLFTNKYRRAPFIHSIISIMFVLFWLVLIREAVLGQLGGTFVRHEMPQDFIALKDATISQQGFFRTLWVPRQSRFSYADSDHRAMEAEVLLGATTAAQLSGSLTDADTRKKMTAMAVKYVVVPMDPLEEIFLDDRKYSAAKRDGFIRALDAVAGLRKIARGGNIIYERDEFWDLFHISGGGSLTYTGNGTNRYRIHINAQEPVTVYFSENHHPGWIVVGADGAEYQTIKTAYGLNSFELNNAGSYDLDVYFRPQKYGDYGYVISSITLLVLIIVLILVRTKKVKYNG